MIIKWQGVEICSAAKYADTFSERMFGLMFKEEMNNFDGLMLMYDGFLKPPFASIHTFFMKFSIDAIFLDKENKVLKIYRNLKPWKMTSNVWGATQILETMSDVVPKELKKGDRLEVCIN